MPRGRPTALLITVTPQEQTTLETYLRSHSLPGLLIRRARLLLLIGVQGVSIRQAAAQVGLGRQHAYKWLKRFQAEGVAGLQDRPRPQDLTRAREAQARKRRERALCQT